MLTVCSALPAILSFIKTAPAIQDIVLHLHWVDSDSGSLGQLDWSLLKSAFPGIHPIHLVISGEILGDSIPPESILEILTENETLKDLVKQDMVTLDPGRIEPLGS